MCAAPAIVFGALLMVFTARGEIHSGDQEEHPEQYDHLPDHHVHEHLPEHYSQDQLFEHENQPKHYAQEHHLEHYAQEHHPEHYAQEHQPKHYAQEHPEHAADHHEHQLQYDYKHEEHQPKHQHVHPDLAMSYQNFNLHVGPQQIVRIPVHRNHIGHNAPLKALHEYPSHGVSDPHKS